ncbi:hypothetical protein CLV35_2740 [Motilibacter peucedani]|uniref:DUF2332 family protein n=1 Tax=Motilibacter peucedani TaxID=598650 RepID=A0A420XMJ0_9ACTN|nr:DUF2332 family protein [Motilibacter peucedani]RKS72496.1 hypothetical protein CLV35_2740 [Motilibacter peucedani]
MPDPPAAPPAVAQLLARQARACQQLGSPMYAALLERLAQDASAGGPTAQLLAPWAGAGAGDAVPLRLMGAVHRLVLERQAPRLALHYPSVGGSFAGADAAWPALLELVADPPQALLQALERVPQTNEVGRAAALAGGLRHVAAATGSSRVRLVELGASAGLNLAVERFRVGGAGDPWGPADARVRLDDAWTGAAPPSADVEVVEAVGVDLDPVDVASTEGRLLLTAYVWADQVERVERLRAAFETVGSSPPPVVAGDAAAFAEGLELVEGVTTVVWHSVFRQYVPAPARGRLATALDSLARSAGPGAGFAHLRLEPREGDDGPGGDAEVRLRVGTGADRLLGSAPAHGVPVTWRHAV